MMNHTTFEELFFRNERFFILTIHKKFRLISVPYIHGHGFWLSTGTVPTVHLKILCKKICTKGTRYVPRVHMEKHFLQIYNWYVPMVQMEKKFVQIYHWYVPMVQMRNHFLQNYNWYVPMVQNGKIFSIFAQK